VASTIEEIEQLIRQVLTTGFRGRLLERGLARSMIWDNGILPADAPHFAENLSYDLLTYGSSLLSLGLRLRELHGDVNLCRAAFEKSALAITDVIQNGNSSDPQKGFHRVLASSAYHLGRFSAKAYSLINKGIEEENLSRMEYGLSLLILRQFNKLEETILEWKKSGIGSDEVLAENISSKIDSLNDEISRNEYNEEFGISSIELLAVDNALTDNYYSAIFEFLFALEIGNQELFNSALARINHCLNVSGELNMLPQWWILKITKHLLDDLWNTSFHKTIPITPDQPYSEEWARLRWLFIASLYKRNKAEIELWPSQLEAAKRAVNDTDNLVVSLPTSAGKTRVAELCILRCLAIGKRVLFITPLRSLSAQTEYSLRKTFLPLGKSVSSLYGSMGTSNFEQDVLRTQDIVVGTPEKLDFALRNDSSLIDDVGLVILDEGHMIGLSEREINYEVQIQRLLKRYDAENRRIVCLSAILPSGDQFDDFVGWLRKDQEGDAIQSDWRPTDLRFGEILWRLGVGNLEFSIGEEHPFINGFVQAIVPPLRNPGLRTTPFPKDGQELTLATAWKLVEDDHTVLIYCPQKSSVNAFAPVIIDLYKRGALGSVLAVPVERLELAKTIGSEWLGAEHPIVKCLDIGVAIHHGSLPTPFRKEMENLLREGILKITVSSPTLAQGLNLTATAVIMHSLHRQGEIIDVSEFKNVIGRAGRAFIDTHGLVLRPIFDKHTNKRKQWRQLIENTNARNMESGLALLVHSLLDRMAQSINASNTNDVLEYVLNHVQVWEPPTIVNESVEQAEEQRNMWNRHIKRLDTALLSMLGEQEIALDDIPNALDTILQASLWQRTLNRNEDGIKTLFASVLSQRAKYIWNISTPLQRKGYFLAGVGLETGQHLDVIAQHANVLLVNANYYIASDDQQNAIRTIIELAELIFDISPFIPKNLPDNWRDILSLWLRGATISECGFTNIDDVLQFVEDGLVYRLPWGLEAIRVRAHANGDVIGEGMTVDDYETDLLVPTIENGTLIRSVALLMQAGFNSRQAAIHAVNSTGASFNNARELTMWLNSELVFTLTRSARWPTIETTSLWMKFISEYKPDIETTWRGQIIFFHADWMSNYNPTSGSFVKLMNYETGPTLVISSDGELIGQLERRFNLSSTGIYYTKIADNTNSLEVTFWGRESDPFEIIN